MARESDRDRGLEYKEVRERGGEREERVGKAECGEIIIIKFAKKMLKDKQKNGNKKNHEIFKLI